MRPMSIEDIGFGATNRRFTAAGKVFVRGDEIPLSILKTMPPANRNALIENRVITVYPKSVTLKSVTKNGKPIVSASQESAPVGELHVVAKGFGKYDVIRGTVELQGATREDADAFIAAAAAKSEGSAAVEQGASPATPDTAPARRAPSKRRKAGKRRSSARRPAAAPAAPPQGEPAGNGPIDE